MRLGGAGIKVACRRYRDRGNCWRTWLSFGLSVGSGVRSIEAVLPSSLIAISGIYCPTGCIETGPDLRIHGSDDVSRVRLGNKPK